MKKEKEFNLSDKRIKSSLYLDEFICVPHIHKAMKKFKNKIEDNHNILIDEELLSIFGKELTK